MFDFLVAVFFDVLLQGWNGWLFFFTHMAPVWKINSTLTKHATAKQNQKYTYSYV